jgi:hypothetical protein
MDVAPSLAPPTLGTSAQRSTSAVTTRATPCVSLPLAYIWTKSACKSLPAWQGEIRRAGQGGGGAQGTGLPRRRGFRGACRAGEKVARGLPPFDLLAIHRWARPNPNPNLLLIHRCARLETRLPPEDSHVPIYGHIPRHLRRLQMPLARHLPGLGGPLPSGFQFLDRGFPGPASAGEGAARW